MKVKRSVVQTTLYCVLSSLVWRLLCGTVLFWVFVWSPSVIIWLWLIDLKALNIACSSYTPLSLRFRPHSHGCPVRSLTIWCILHTKSVEWTYQFLSVWLGLCNFRKEGHIWFFNMPDWKQNGWIKPLASWLFSPRHIKKQYFWGKTFDCSFF